MLNANAMLEDLCAMCARPREARYAKNHFQQNRYSVFESHVMQKESISTKIFKYKAAVTWCRQ